MNEKTWCQLVFSFINLDLFFSFPLMSRKEKIARTLSDQDQIFKSFRNLDLNVCIEGED